MSLKNKIVKKISLEGSLSISKFMEMCMWDTEEGYYFRKNIIGEKGDFTTSPELSQTFGELIGIWSLSCHINKLKNEKLSLLELGPGKGTLIDDGLRAINKIVKNEFSPETYLLEKSPILQEIQKEKLEKHSIQWINDIGEMPEKPLIIIANEFFDSLPINQYLRVQEGWKERKIGLKDSNLCITLDKRILKFKANYFQSTPLGEIIEYSYDTIKIFSKICDHIKEFGSIALIIDYGEISGFGDTLQAIKNHNSNFILDNPGESDLSSHVNFGILANIALERNLRVSPIIEQYKFLKNLGIETRMKRLIENKPTNKLIAEIKGIRKLIDPENMGKLFKVMAFSNRKNIEIEGFC